jgi:GTP-binding protein HflX
VYVENQLFATLDPTSRNLTLPSGKEIVLTDTVGFIQNLPHDLVAAFRATLEEVCEADLIVHVVDSSSDMRSEQMRVVAEVLEELGAHGKEQLTLFNKIDLCPPGEASLLTASGSSLKISAYNPDDLERVKLGVQEKLMGDKKMFRIPADKGDLIALVYRIGDVLEQEVDGDDMLYQVKVNGGDFEKLGYMLAPYTAQEGTAAQITGGEG